MRHVHVDLVILNHERAFEAGPEAMGLWLFMLAWTHNQKRGGFVPARIAHAAWGGRANAKLADRLVASKLVERVDDGYRVVNYAVKNKSRPVARTKSGRTA